MSNEAKQRFLALDVLEVSVVDTPANEVEFAVIKRKSQESEMSAENAPQSVTQTPANVAPVQTVDTNKGLETAFKDLTTLIQNISKASQQTVDPEIAESAADAAVEKSKAGMGAVRKNFRASLVKAGLKDDAYVAAMKSFDETHAPAQVDTTKASDADAASKLAGEAMDQLSQTINKAKVFTPARQAQLLQLAETLKAVIDDLIQIPQATMPATNTPGLAHSLTTSLGVGVTKALEDLTALVTKSVEAQTAMATRLENVEKARIPGNGNAVDSTDKTVAKAKAPSLWKSVI